MTTLKKLGSALAVSLLMIGIPLVANADRGSHQNGGHHRGHGHYSHRPQVHINWHHGHWRHGHHHGRVGWWWVVGPAWHFYPRAVYPYPAQQAAVVVAPQPAAPNLPPPAQYWYYCESAAAYYPYVATCAEAWKPVPATPQ